MGHTHMLIHVPTLHDYLISSDVLVILRTCNGLALELRVKL
jgi:hypothetical protein